MRSRQTPAHNAKQRTKPTPHPKKAPSITKRTIASIAGLAALLALLGACYGSFALTKAVYRWNSNIESRFTRSAVMVALVVLPAYPVVAATDAVVLNVLEFWSGQNPVSDLGPSESLTPGTDEQEESSAKIETTGDNKSSSVPSASAREGNRLPDASVTPPPVTSSVKKTVSKVEIGPKGSKVTITPTESSDSAVDLRVEDTGAVAGNTTPGARLRRRKDGSVVASPLDGGRPVVARPKPNGGVDLLSPDGDVVRSLTPAEVEELFSHE